MFKRIKKIFKNESNEDIENIKNNNVRKILADINNWINKIKSIKENLLKYYETKDITVKGEVIKPEDLKGIQNIINENINNFLSTLVKLKNEISEKREIHSINFYYEDYLNVIKSLNQIKICSNILSRIEFINENEKNEIDKLLKELYDSLYQIYNSSHLRHAA